MILRAWLWLLDALAPGPRCAWCRARLAEKPPPRQYGYCGDECRAAHATDPSGW